MQREDVLRIAGEPVGEMREVEDMNNHTFNRRFTIEPEMFDEPQVGTKLYTEAQLLAVAATTESRSYAAGAEAMRERAAEFFEEMQRKGNSWVSNVAASAAIRALPITPTNTEGEQE